MPRLLRFGCGVGIEHDTGAGPHVRNPVLHEGGTDHDRRVERAVVGQVADRATVGAAFRRLVLSQQFRGADLGRPDERSHVQRGGIGMECVEPLAQFADDLGDQVHDVLVAFDGEQPRDVSGAGAADSGHIVPGQVDQHQVLGQFLGVGHQGGLMACVQLGVEIAALGPAARCGSRDGSDGDAPGRAFDAHRRFRRSAQQRESRGADEKLVRAGVGRAKACVGGQRVPARYLEGPRRDDLEHVPGDDVTLELPDQIGVGLVVDVDGHTVRGRTGWDGGWLAGPRLFDDACQVFDVAHGVVIGSLRVRPSDDQRDDRRGVALVIDDHGAVGKPENVVGKTQLVRARVGESFVQIDQVVGKDPGGEVTERFGLRDEARSERRGAKRIERARGEQARPLVQFGVCADVERARNARCQRDAVGRERFDVHRSSAAFDP